MYFTGEVTSTVNSEEGDCTSRGIIMCFSYYTVFLICGPYIIISNYRNYIHIFFGTNHRSIRYDLSVRYSQLTSLSQL